MAASDPLSPNGEEVAGRSPEPSVPGTPGGHVTGQTEIQHLGNMFTVAGSGQMHFLSRNLLLAGGVFKNVRKLRNWKDWDPRNGSKSKRVAKKTKGRFRKISRWQLFYRPAWGVSSITVKTDRG